MTRKTAANETRAQPPDARTGLSTPNSDGAASQRHDRSLAPDTLLGNLPGMVYRCRNDRDRTMQLVSDGAIRLTGYAPADFLAGNPTYAGIIHADDREGVWDDLQAALAARRPFQVVYRITTASNEERWVWEQGCGVHAEDQHLLHLEGLIVDITERRQMEERLRESEERFRALSNLSSDWYWESDAQCCFTRFEGRYAERDGSPYAHFVGQRWWDVDLWIEGATDKEKAQHDLVAGHHPFYNVDMYTHAPDGSRFYMSVSAEPMTDAEGRFLGYRGVSRNVTKRKRDDAAMAHLSQMYATLTATNEAILRARCPDEIYQKVCDAAVHGGKFISAGVVAIDPESAQARVIAAVGIGAQLMRTARISVDPSLPEGNGMVGHAYRSGQPAICNDYLNDPLMAPWRDAGAALGARASGAIPVRQHGAITGVLLFYSSEKDAFNYEIVTSLERTAENVSFALDNFERDEERRRTERRLRESEERFKSLTELSSDWYWEQDEKFRFTRFDGRYVERARAAFGQFIGRRPWDDGFEIESGEDSGRMHRAVLESRARFHNVVMSARLNDGSRIHMSLSGEPYFDSNGNFKGYRGTGRDISARVYAEAEMRKLSSAIQQTADCVMITDREGTIEYVNGAFERITGYTREESIGRKPNLVKSGVHGAGFHEQLWRTVLSGETFSDIFINRKKSGELYYEEKTISPLRDEHGRITHFISTGRDITERMQAQERLQHIAHHDALTGLPNRVLLLDRLDQALLRAHWQHRVVGVMFLDLDRFKNVNDTLGHDVGDALLKAMAARLQGCVRERDSVARLGGDEFAVLLEEVAHADDISRIAAKILGAFASPFSIHSHELFITTSIGISMYPADGTTSATLLKNADAAMYRAKDLGKNNYQFYSADMSTAAFQRLTLESNLRRALERGEFVLHYQPQVDIASGQIIGVEALLRWQHPDFGLLAPTQFVPIAEETGAIVPIGEWVARTAMGQVARWRKLGLPNLRVAVNVSGRQFNEPSFLDTVAYLLQEMSLPADALELEITESVIMKNAAMTIERLQALHAMGVRFAIDDFGTGYSSLSYLRRFAIHTLKIDQSFIRDVVAGSDSMEIVKTIIVMARGLKLSVIAEGVEAREQLMFLRSHGCHAVQGNLIARPLPAERMSERLQRMDTRPWLP